MDFTVFFEKARPLSDVYPELRRLFPTVTALAKALDLLLRSSSKDVAQRSVALRQHWLSQNSGDSGEAQRARIEYRELAAENKRRGYWLHGGELSKDQKAILLRHLHKLRSLQYPVSYDIIEDMTGIPHKSSPSWYKTWLKKQHPEELKLLANHAASTYKYDSALINDSERAGSLSFDDQRVWDAPEGESGATGELVRGRDFPAMDAYECAVKEFKRTKKGEELEGRIVLFKALAPKLDEIAVEHGVNLGISWSKHSWSMQPDLSYPDISTHAFRYVKSQRKCHKGLLLKLIEEAVEKLRPMQPEIDTLVRDCKTCAVQTNVLSDSSTISGVGRRRTMFEVGHREEEKDALEGHGLETTDCISSTSRKRKQAQPPAHRSKRTKAPATTTPPATATQTPPLSVEDALSMIEEGFPKYVKISKEEMEHFQNRMTKGQRTLSEEELQTFKAEAATKRKQGKFVSVTKDVFMRMVSLVFSTNVPVNIIADISGVEVETVQTYTRRLRVIQKRVN